jgi:hypothetical protein
VFDKKDLLIASGATTKILIAVAIGVMPGQNMEGRAHILSPGQVRIETNTSLGEVSPSVGKGRTHA